MHLRRGRCKHERLPVELHNIDLSARLVDGVVPEAKLTAASGPARFEARVANLRAPADPSETACFESLLDELDARVEHLPVDDDLLGHLPADLKYLKEDFLPFGPLTIGYRYRCAESSRHKTQITYGSPGGGPPKVREWTLEPEGMSGAYREFRYPVKDVRGKLHVDTSAAPLRNIRVDLTGQAGGAPFKLRGTIKGEKGASEVILDISSQDVLLDETLYKALPERVQHTAGQFLPQASRQRGLAACPMENEA
jgi:hypothetical protein